MDNAILNQFQTTIVILDERGTIIFSNQAFLEKSGFSKEEVMGVNAEWFMSDLKSILMNQYGQTYLKTKKGQEISYWIEVNHLEGQDQIGLILADIKMSGLDPLTKLPNRYLFQRHLQRAIEKANETNQLLAVLYMDLDRFKFINDTLGHTYGDLLLKEVSQRLKSCIGMGNIVARMGGDEFVFLLTDLQQVNDADLRLHKVLAAFQEPFQLKETEIYVNPSIGISLYPYDGDEIESLITNADTAMYRAKKRGHYKVEKASLDYSAGSYEKLMIENGLYSALAKNQFNLHFQPQIQLKNHKVVGMEALLRWEHPDLGIIPPAEFIPIAEETGLILPIGDWVIKHACQKIRQWLDSGIQNCKVAVNLSAKQFLQNDLVDKIQNVLDEYQVPANCLEIEVTESMMMYDIESAIHILDQLKEKGIHITIDDFGKGYSSLQYLQKLPLDTLKIDRSFIFDIDTNPSSKALTNAISNLAHALHMEVIAEGVETKKQLRHVQKLKCDAVQGFYYSKPLSSEAADRYMLENNGVETIKALI
ncbi:EAL domain-containing protein [Neobacillus niacini]|uniref:sensor domain-containing protein n=1 Tax=Neobacillus niacini TaxID=86668 RepID=UPI0028666AD3|nr:EAL domain-containing protein [Neobacillus niacini]MDR7000985.1 diguanylate cyclase (GGDEF)-like protein [Neobacillus niacini]